MQIRFDCLATFDDGDDVVDVQSDTVWHVFAAVLASVVVSFSYLFFAVSASLAVVAVCNSNLSKWPRNWFSLTDGNGRATIPSSPESAGQRMSLYKVCEYNSLDYNEFYFCT